MKGSIGTSTHLVKGYKIPSSAAEGGSCPSCLSSDSNKLKGIMLRRRGKFGDFLGCSRYPECKYIVGISTSKPKYQKPKFKKQKRVRFESYENFYKAIN
jgi:ssDNA-binding Zn-finger/Zn-ribbon topoisomerase 1